MKKYLFFPILIIVLMSCSQTKETNAIQSKSASCQLIEKTFTHKGGDFTEYKEFYLHCSSQDYFIKVCESNVTKEQLKPYLNKNIEIDMEVKEGLLDHCEAIPAYAQSRTGTYIVIKKIIK